MAHFRTSAVSSRKLWFSLCLGWLLAIGCAEAMAQKSAGQVMVATGTVKAYDLQGRERLLQKGDAVAPGDRIVTAADALVQLRMADGGYMSVRPATEMKIDLFVFDEKNQGNSNFLVSLIKGGFRSITGLIGKGNPDAYQIRTPTATIGIRGTDHEPMYIPPAAPNAPAGNAPGLYDKVNDGETFIRNQHGLLSLKPGQIGFSPAKPDAAPRMLQRVPDFYKVNLKIEGRDGKDSSDKSDDGKRPASAGALRPTAASRLGTLNTAEKSTLIEKAGDATQLRTDPGSITSPATVPLAGDKTLAPVNADSTQLKQVSPTLTTTPQETLNTTKTINTTTISPLQSPALAPALAPAPATAPAPAPTTQPAIIRPPIQHFIQR